MPLRETSPPLEIVDRLGTNLCFLRSGGFRCIGVPSTSQLAVETHYANTWLTGGSRWKDGPGARQRRSREATRADEDLSRRHSAEIIES